MMRALPTAPSLSWFALWLLLAGLFFGQFGDGPSLWTAWTTTADPGCAHGCPCEEEVAEVGDDASHPHAPGLCPDEDGSQCLPGCDDCTCCMGTMAAVAPILAPSPPLPADGPVLNAPPDDPPTRFPGRIFRPPRPRSV